MLMSLIIGWEVKPQRLRAEIETGSKGGVFGFWAVCIKFIVPVVMCFISAGSIADYFGSATIGYAVAIALLLIYWAMTRCAGWLEESEA